MAGMGVVVSYYDHPRLMELYPSPTWTLVHAPMPKAMMCGNGRGQVGSKPGPAAIAPEVLLINGPSLTAKADHGGLFS